ncbi:MAG: hypothetical protein V9G22_01700 [Ottowia sp.]|jgi:hypothetical protein
MPTTDALRHLERAYIAHSFACRACTDVHRLPGTCRAGSATPPTSCTPNAPPPAPQRTKQQQRP